MSKNKKNIKILLMKFLFFTTEKNLCISHGHVFVMHVHTFITCFISYFFGKEAPISCDDTCACNKIRSMVKFSIVVENILRYAAGSTSLNR